MPVSKEIVMALRPGSWIRARRQNGRVRIGLIIKQNRALSKSGRKTGKSNDLTVFFPSHKSSDYDNGWVQFRDVVEVLEEA